MQQCPNCKHQNRAGIVFCENCGASLIGRLPVDTKSLESSSEEEKAQIGIDSSILTDVKVQGRAVFEEDAFLQLEVEGSPEAMLFKPKPETIFGRRDPATGAMPDIDLTPYAGYRMGVSRRHAAIRHGDEQSLDLWDLGSSNGTFLNGQRLSAHRPYRLHDGDELRLGQMVIRLYFKSSSEVPEPPAPPDTVKPAETASAAPAAEVKPAESAPVASSPSDEAKPTTGEAPVPAPEAPKPQPITTQLPDAKPVEVPKTVQITEEPKAPPEKKPEEPSAPSAEPPKPPEASTKQPTSQPEKAPPAEPPSENGKKRDSA